MKKVNSLIGRCEGELASGGIWMEWYIDTGVPGGVCTIRVGKVVNGKKDWNSFSFLQTAPASIQLNRN